MADQYYPHPGEEEHFDDEDENEEDGFGDMGIGDDKKRKAMEMQATIIISPSGRTIELD